MRERIFATLFQGMSAVAKLFGYRLVGLTDEQSMIIFSDRNLFVNIASAPSPAATGGLYMLYMLLEAIRDNSLMANLDRRTSERLGVTSPFGENAWSDDAQGNVFVYPIEEDK